VYLSVPCLVGKEGVLAVISQSLNESETQKFKECARKMIEVIKKIEL
jgi:malate/lactate dehydrogenase